MALPIMSQVVHDEIDRATRLGQRLEDLVVRRNEFRIKTDRDDVIIACWSLIFEYQKGILCLLGFQYYAPAFALLRPVVDALVRCYVAHLGSDEEVRRIRQDRYSVNYEKDGIRIDKAIGASSPVLETYLKGVRSLLHSFTHSGTAQLSRRFDGNVVAQSFSDAAITALIRNSSSAVFMVTALITSHFDFDQESQETQRIWIEYSRLGASVTEQLQPNDSAHDHERQQKAYCKAPA
jgi:hypothetical protein